MRFFITDTAADARVTFGVEVDGRIVGNVSQMAIDNQWQATDAGPYCRTPRGAYTSREAAARALNSARRNCRAEHIDHTGLMQIDRDVLDFEAAASIPTEDDRQREAARLGISPTLYRQIARRMRLDARAAAYSPKAVERLRAQHKAALARTARFRPAAAALAQAS